MPYDFSGKKAIVTGGGRGIGRGVVEGLVKAGAEVWALSRTRNELDLLEKEVPNTHAVQVDLADWEKTQRVVEDIGPVDLLVNNAGIALLTSFLDIQPEEFDSTFAVNVKPIICVSQVVVKHMIASGRRGSIVNVSSHASQRALQNHTVYCASKAAMDSITKNMALELGLQKIRVNSVNPTVTWTKMAADNWTDPVKNEAHQSKIPLGKFVEVEDVVNSVLFLLSDKSAMITGHNLPVDGGLWAV